MSCPETTNTLTLLSDTLNREKTLARMGHVRACPPCKAVLQERAASIKSAGVGAGAGWSEPAAPRRMAFPGLFSVFGRASADAAAAEAGGARRVRIPRWMWVIVGACVVMGVMRARKPGGPADAAQQLRATIGAGTPVCESPSGPFTGRPRVITAVLPAGARAFRILILDDDGHVAFEGACQAGVAGCVIDEVDLGQNEASLRACRALVPFPDAATLPLTAGRPYGIACSIGGGHASQSVVFATGMPAAADER